MSTEIDRLVALSRLLGDPARGLAILGEGNTSIRLANGRMVVKASGASLGAATADDFVELEPSALLALLDDPDADDETVAREFAAVESRTGRRPSVEAMLHAVCLELGGAAAVGHTHPVPVLAILCSPHAEALATEMLFPDQVVVLGRSPLYVPYVDPGLVLARRVRDELSAHAEPPNAIYLGNHGLFALGRTPEEVVQITEMAVKAALVLAGALAAGGVRALSPAAADRIHGRPDEHYRRAALGSA
ncbi:MAG TPA: class II aldolase/adducin family protein [Solirubrobacteraceae bacterium]|nr:class II aldolase/adducin family protein [Solirubrobacteraceae bacterium]